MNLRSDCISDVIIGKAEERNLAEFIRLPTKRSVLARYLWFRSKGKKIAVRDVFKNVLIELESLWVKAAVPTQSTHRSLHQLISLHRKWEHLKKEGSVNLKNNPALQKKLTTLHEEFSELCNISADDALEQLKASRKKTWKEDWDFLENQRGSRTWHMSNIDQQSIAIETRKRVRFEEENLRRSKSAEPQIIRSHNHALTNDEIREVIEQSD
ncbi:Cc8K15.2-like protein, partial [Daphnia magna]